MIILDGHRVLMGKELGPDFVIWETPGGGLRPAETLEECCRREALEEIGTRIRIKQEMPRFRSTVEIQPTAYDPDVHWLMVYCVCEAETAPSLELATDPEFEEIRFIDRFEHQQLAEQGVMALPEQQFLPGILEELGVWP